MSNIIDLLKLKRGSSGDVAVASLERGEPAVSLDTKELWIGDGIGKIKITDTNFYNSSLNFPSTGIVGKLYIANDTAAPYIWDATTLSYKKYELLGQPAVVHCRVRMDTLTAFPSYYQDLSYPIKESETEVFKLKQDPVNLDRIIFLETGYYRITYNITYNIPPVGGTRSNIDSTVNARINKNDSNFFVSSESENVHKLYFVNEGITDELTNEVVEYFTANEWVSIQVMASGDPSYIVKSNLEVYKIDSIKGDTGTSGIPGSIWFNGSGIPGGAIGNNNDYYLNIDNSDVYHKQGESWILVDNIRGDVGPSGEISLIALTQSRRTTSHSVGTAWEDIYLDYTDSETNNTVLKHDTTNTDRVYIFESGWYEIDYFYRMIVSSSFNWLFSRIIVNDSIVIPASELSGNFYQQESQDLKATFSYYFNAGDFITVQMMRNAASITILQPNLILLVKKLQGIKGNPGPVGPIGPQGEPFHIDEYNNLDEAKITSIETTSGATSQDPYYLFVLVDTRSNQILPASLNGDMSQHVIMFDGTIWFDFGSFIGFKGDTGEQGPPGTDGVFQDLFYNSSETEQQTTSNQFQQKVLLSVNLTGGNYRISWYYEWNYNTGSRSFKARVQVDNVTTLMEQIQEPQDTASTQFHPVSGFKYETLSAGTHDIDLDWCCTNTGDRATIRRARLEIWKVPS